MKKGIQKFFNAILQVSISKPLLKVPNITVNKSTKFYKLTNTNSS
jgi:hypothetical protein